MVIRFISTEAAPEAVVRTRSRAAPLDSGISLSSRKIPEASRKIEEPSRKIDGNYLDAVSVKKRGRPPTEQALSAAERARRYRERKKAV